MEYEIKFDKNNSNVILIYKDAKLINLLACPPIEKGCDIINFSDTLSDGYIFNFNGLILITTKIDRKLYYKGDLIAETKRYFKQNILWKKIIIFFKIKKTYLMKYMKKH